jgi:ABC-2 type transport system permease protein
MKVLRRIAYRELRRLFSRKVYLFCIFVVPLLCCLFFLSLMHKGLPTNLPVAAVDRDGSTVSRALLRELNTFQGVEITAKYPDFHSARLAVQSGEVYGIFLIPERFAAQLAEGKQPVLSFYTNNSYLVAGALSFRDMKIAAMLAMASAVTTSGEAKGYTAEQVRAMAQPVVIETHPIGNPMLNYSIYLNNVILPGILGLLIMCVTVFSIGIEIKEKTVGEWLGEQNAALTPALLGKLLPHFILFFIIGIAMYALMFGGTYFPLYGHGGAMLLDLGLFIFASQALGVFMIGCLPTLRLGLSFACIFGMISFSISGFSFPTEAMYPEVQALSNLFPLRHYFVIYADQVLSGRALPDSALHYAALLAFGLLPLLVLRNLKWSLRHLSYQA